MLFVHIDTEYEVHTYCPHCGDEDVVINIDRLGFFKFYRCNNCGYMEKPNKIHRNNLTNDYFL